MRNTVAKIKILYLILAATGILAMSFLFFFINGWLWRPLTPFRYQLCTAIHFNNAIKQYNCYEKLVLEIIQKDDIQAAAIFVRERADSLGYGKCHNLMHRIGRAAYKKYELIENAYEAVETFWCSDGYTHGVAEQFFMDQLGSFPLDHRANGDIKKIISSSCKKYNDVELPPTQSSAKNSLDAAICFHALGHGIMFALKNDIRQSLQNCDILPLYWHIENCHNGVFMENALSHFSFIAYPGSKNYVHQENPQYACDRIDEKYKLICYKFVGLIARSKNPADFKLAFVACDNIARKDGQKVCYGDVGRTVASFVKNFTDIAHTCLETKPEWQETCLYNAAIFIRRYYPHHNKAALEFCSKLPTMFSEKCSSIVINDKQYVEND